MSIFKKYENNPVFGSISMGTAYDAYTTFDGEKYRMDFSYRKMMSCAVTFSKDGINWEEPQITMPPKNDTGWEERISRDCVLLIDGVYKMWYTGMENGKSYIGYAESKDGINFERYSDKPILSPETECEKIAVMNPCVLYENGIYRMWYSAGEIYEPNVMCYAESKDGINWTKHKNNPVMECEKSNVFEQDRIGGCQVIKTDDMGYVMFYIGYEDVDTARVCVAHSENGIDGWKRSKYNPLVCPDADSWDNRACYKPTVVWNEEKKQWMLWYNGRNDEYEFIGLCTCDKRNLFE